ncbi:GerW family sporulation protein [Geomicrobium sp. JCM 19038]|uniref:GerW family sporulation protein n=1 Tax=Geomicrobium sp. JCM 19038 TaxID=1460635 RepID=UPI00045F1318|nr:GerW family sporulation protein [Geomicrobium sp. JCM 19038]GAK09668.1 sporulation protein YtfJ [Geomicrobium sp. JCM 19038]
MAEHPIQGLMKTAMENIKEMVDVNTIIGDPVESPDGNVIIPVSKVGFGFAAGGTEMNVGHAMDEEERHPFGGGSGGGVSITPVAFLIVGTHGVKMIHLNNGTHFYEKLLELTPQVVEKIKDLIQGNEHIEDQSLSPIDVTKKETPPF